MNILSYGIFSVSAVILLLACSTPPKLHPGEGDIVAEFPKMSVGDTWVVSQHDDDYGSARYTYKITSVEPDGSFQIKSVSEKNQKARSYYFDSSATGVHHILGIMFDPAGLQFPLFVGKAWQTEVLSPSVGGDYYTYIARYKVEELTKVTTEVGIFEAFRIRGNIKNADTNWKGISNFWYAPAAKAIVRSTHTHTRGLELLEMDLVD